VIEPGFRDFFLAVAGASATLIGLLFVAVSVAPEQVVGPKALALHQIRATMALTAFASTLVLSLIAVMPDAHIGWPATVIGGGGIWLSLSILLSSRKASRDSSQRRAFGLILVFLLIMISVASSGIRSIIEPHAHDPVSDVGIAVIALIALGIDRSWELVGGRTAGITGFLTDRYSGGKQSPDGPSGRIDTADEAATADH
jgi:hypothetical protein